MRIAMIGTRGVPARYGGFETAVEEIGSRLAKRGHQVVVYCRGEGLDRSYLGMERVRLPAIRRQSMETLSHTAVSVAHLAFHRTDVAVLFNAANAPLLPAIRISGIPVAVHVDGLEWQRAKWGPAGRRYYLTNERLAVRLSNRLIADARGIQDYYRTKYRAESVLLTYGAPIVNTPNLEKLAGLGLEAKRYHLVVTRLEPENNVHTIIEGYNACAAEYPLVVVGSVPYPGPYQQRLEEAAGSNPNVRMLGGIWDQDLLDTLYACAGSYLHGHSVGGTNPSLLRAMGAGACVIALDVTFNREVLGDAGLFFTDQADVENLVELAEHSPEAATLGRAAQERAVRNYQWDDVADGYEKLCSDLAEGRRGAR